jgi:uncharacterized peroxidase-related enzyme
MSRIRALDPASTQGKTRETLTAVNKMLGATPNLFRVAANAPSVLEGLVGLIGTAAQGTLKAGVREAIALTVAEANGCNYCLAAHTVLGKGAGLGDEAIDRARDATSSDPKTQAMLRFARSVVVARGKIGETDAAQLRAAGVSDAETLEILHNVVVNVLTNYINLVAQTEIDFPEVRAAK